jgi:gamma-glutamyltranspeptidase
MIDDPDWRAVFVPKGILLGGGDFIQRKSLATTLDVIAKEGAGAFYKVRREI